MRQLLLLLWVSLLADCVLVRNYLGSDLFTLFVLCCIAWLDGGLCCFDLGVVWLCCLLLDGGVCCVLLVWVGFWFD